MAFRTTGEYGEGSFSDVELPGATQIDLPTTVIEPARIADQQAIIDQQLRVAKALEDSRLARQAAVTERLLALAASRPQVVYVEPQEYRATNGYYFPRRLPWQHRKHRQGPQSFAATTASARHRKLSHGSRNRRAFQPLYPGIPRLMTGSARQSRGHRHSLAAQRPSTSSPLPTRADMHR